MQVVRLDRLDDPRFVDRDLYRDIGDHDRLRVSGLFVAEGRFVVSRLIEHHARLVRSLLLNASAHRALGDVCAALADDVSAFVCDSRDFEALTGYNLHRGCLALAARPSEHALDDLIAGARTLLLVEGVANADNVGGIFRNAAAFGVDAVILTSGCVDPLYRKAIRTSMGASLTVPFAIVDDGLAWLSALERLERDGVQLIALTPDPSGTDLDTFVCRGRADRIALLVGAEGPGLTPESLAAAAVRVRIPTRTEVDSLNVSVASGIALHRLAARTSR